MPKEVLARSVPAMDWKTRSMGAPCSKRRKLRGDVRQHAALRGNRVALTDRVNQVEELYGAGNIVGRRD